MGSGVLCLVPLKLPPTFSASPAPGDGAVTTGFFSRHGGVNSMSLLSGLVVLPGIQHRAREVLRTGRSLGAPPKGHVRLGYITPLS